MRSTLKNIIKQHFFRPRWCSVLFNPYFIARASLYREIRRFAAQDFSGRNILDVGCGAKPYQQLFSAAAKYIGIDIAGGGHFDQAKEVDQFYDGQNIPFPDNSFEVVICTQVLEHAASPEKLITEISRVLKPAGQLCLTMPLVWSEHEIPYDFRRFTRYEHQRLLAAQGLSIESLTATTGTFGVTGQLLAAFIFESWGRRSRLAKALVALLLCFPIQAISIILDKIFHNSWITLDYVIIAKK